MPTFELPVPNGSVVVKNASSVDKINLSSKELITLDDQYGTAGLPSLPVVIARAQGAQIWDVEGKKYTDFLSAFSVVNQGHCHPRIIQAMIDQCQKVTLASHAYYNEQFPLLTRKLCQMFGFDMVSAMNSGSEAIDIAIKIARKWSYVVKGVKEDEALVLTCSGNYHGKTLMAISASDDSSIKIGFGPYVPGIGPNCASRPIRFNVIEDLEHVLKTDGHRIAAFLVECVQGYGGCIAARDGYIKAARELCKKYNVLFIADEIQCGFGRTGYMMAYQREGIQPDMVVIGKALTGGVYPMGCVMGMKDVMSQLLKGDSTFSGNPLGSAVAIEAINVIVEEQLPQRAAILGEKFVNHLRNIKSPHIAGVNGRGFLCALVLDESHPSGRVTAKRLAALLMQRGVLAYCAHNRIRLAPPLMIPEELLWEAVSKVETALADLVNISEFIYGEDL